MYKFNIICNSGETSIIFSVYYILQTSEDCLYLNIWTPLNAVKTSGYPVMVFIHGGSFRWGSGDLEVYDGNRLAVDANLVVVNIDYRLGMHNN